MKVTNLIMAERLKLLFQHATDIMDSTDEGLLILTDSNESRQVAIPCPEDKVRFLARRMKHDKQFDQELPDVLTQMLLWQDNAHYETVIDSVGDGHYHAFINDRDTLLELPIKAEDAVILNYLSNGDIPIYIDSVLFMKQSTPYDAHSKGVSLPVNTISEAMLKVSLEKAIKDENYELASRLRDEMNLRKHKGKKDTTDEVASTNTDEA